MTAKCNWFFEELDIPAEDLDTPPSPLIEELAARVDLRDRDSLVQDVHLLLRRENDLFNGGVMCAIKQVEDTSCSACPLRCTDAENPLAALCEVGTEQERVTTLLAIHSHVARPA